jgi:uncharacterized protein YegL
MIGMSNNITEIIFVLDRSGSMSGLESDTIGGFNSLVRKQCQLEGETILTTVLFDDKYEVLWNGVDAKQVELTEKEYFVRGTTALLDAVGKTILDVDNRLKYSSEERKPEKVLFVITTDGLENASREFSYQKIHQMITERQEKHGWDFMFLGANIDVSAEASNLGINQASAYNFESTNDGVAKMYDSLNEQIVEKRSGRVRG